MAGVYFKNIAKVRGWSQGLTWLFAVLLLEGLSIALVNYFDMIGLKILRPAEMDVFLPVWIGSVAGLFALTKTSKWWKVPPLVIVVLNIIAACLLAAFANISLTF